MAPQNDFFRDPALALSLLTRLPVKLDEETYNHSAKAAWAYPLVGVVTGIIACLAANVALWLGLPIWAAAIFAVASGVIVTGAMHEDGLADCADGFWGGWDPAMRLKIMNDSQLGTYGMLALLLTFAMRIGAIIEILHWDSWAFALIAVHIASRAVMPAILSNLPQARDTGLSRSVGKVLQSSAIKAVALGAIALVLAFGLYGIVLAIVAALSTLLFAKLAQKKVGGQTGDVCGGAQQVAEITLLLALIASY